jgi:hypothetical protein
MDHQFKSYPKILQEGLCKQYYSPDQLKKAQEPDDPMKAKKKPLRTISDREKELLVQIAKIVGDYNRSENEMHILKVYEMFHRINRSMANTSPEYGKNARFCFVVLHLIYNVIPDNFLKYQDTNSFLSSYPIFVHYDAEDVKILCAVANWMNVLFNIIIPANKNKGLILAAVTKFVEGHGVDYITGQGQTKETSARVTIYQIEGNVTPEKRGCRRKLGDVSSAVSSDVDDTPKRKKNRKEQPIFTSAKDLQNSISNLINVQHLDPYNSTISMVNVSSLTSPYYGHINVPPGSIRGNESLTGYPPACQRMKSVSIPDDVLSILGMGKDSSFSFVLANNPLTTETGVILPADSAKDTSISLINSDREISLNWSDNSISDFFASYIISSTSS